MQQPYAYKPNWIKISLLALGLAAIITGGFFLAKKIFWKPAPTMVYEALVAVTDQKAGDPAEDLRSSLKAGDVLVILPEGHSWSDTEKNSYLLIKMKLTEEQAKNLTQPEQKERKQEARNTEQKAQSKEDSGGPQMETIRARAYRLKIETLGFDVQKFWENPVQPYLNQTFDKKLIEKKKSVN